METILVFEDNLGKRMRVFAVLGCPLSVEEPEALPVALCSLAE